MHAMHIDSPRPRVPLTTLAGVFLRLGATSFGGPAAHIALMEDEIVRRRGWISHEEFLDLLGAVNLIPGPNSTEMAIHIGHKAAGWPGLVVAGTCFILPAFWIVLLFAWIYIKYHSLPSVTWLLYGIKPVIIAIVVRALWRLGQSCIKSWSLGLLAAICAGMVALGVDELAVVFGAGLAVVLTRQLLRSRKALAVLLLPLADTPPWPHSIFLVFAKIGSVLFGSGYVLLAYLRSDLVERRGWLTEEQLLDAVAIGQVAPGPVFTTATFLGYLIDGWQGAIAATVGIFLPAFTFVALSVPLLPRLMRSETARAFLDGVTVASLALMAVVTMQLVRAAVVDVPTALLALLSAAVLLRWRINSAWLVLAGAGFGLLRLLIDSVV